MSSSKKTHRVRTESGAGSGTDGDWWEDAKDQKLDASREASNTKQKQQIETLKTEVSKLTNENSKLKTDKDNLTDDVKSYKVKSAEQKAHFEGLQNEIETLKDGNKAKDKKIDALEKELAALKKKVKEMEENKKEMEEKIEELEDDNEKLAQENSDRSAALERLQTFPPSPKSTESRLSRPTMSGALPNTPTPIRSKSKAGRNETKEERRERKAREARREQEEAQRRLRGRFERSSDDDDRSQGSNDRHRDNRDSRDHRNKHRPAGPQDSVYAEAWPATSTQPQYPPQSPTYPNATRFPAPYDPNYAPPLTQVATLPPPPTNYYPARSTRGGR